MRLRTTSTTAAAAILALGLAACSDDDADATPPEPPAAPDTAPAPEGDAPAEGAAPSDDAAPADGDAPSDDAAPEEDGAAPAPEDGAEGGGDHPPSDDAAADDETVAVNDWLTTSIPVNYAYYEDTTGVGTLTGWYSSLGPELRVSDPSENPGESDYDSLVAAEREGPIDLEVDEELDAAEGLRVHHSAREGGAYHTWIVENTETGQVAVLEMSRSEADRTTPDVISQNFALTDEPLPEEEPTGEDIVDVWDGWLGYQAPAYLLEGGDDSANLEVTVGESATGQTTFDEAVDAATVRASQAGEVTSEEIEDPRGALTVQRIVSQGEDFYDAQWVIEHNYSGEVAHIVFESSPALIGMADAIEWSIMETPIPRQ